MTNYADAGVDIDAGNRAVKLMGDAVRSTNTPAVLSELGAFGGLFSTAGLGDGSVLVASTDGVGTKVELAARHGGWNGVGRDLVNHCVDDILVQGARPLFFLDYIATAKLVPEIVAEIVTGMAEACKEVGCALLGGETAEMPGVYTEGSVDIAGTIVGAVHRDALWPRTDDLRPGDVLLGMASDSPHTNGYSLIRLLLDRHDDDPSDDLIEWLLTPHKSYLGEVDELGHLGSSQRRSPTSPAVGSSRTFRGCCPTASAPRSSSAPGTCLPVSVTSSSSAMCPTASRSERGTWAWA